MDFEKFVVRFNASGGGSDHDEWLAKNVKAHIQACDPTAPTVLSNYKVSGGRHQKGNTIYVSVAFSEIVTVTGTPTLSSNWGTLSYVAGSGSNVLTFMGTIDPSDNNAFGVSGYTLNGGTIKDLAGNSFSGSISHSFGTTLDEDYAWTTSDFNQLETNTYEIYTTLDMRHLALMVNSGNNNNCSGLTFRQTHDITYTHKTEWDDATSTENNYIAIGTDDNPFLGTFDGQGYTVSGIRIYRGGTSNSDYYQGLFGVVRKNGTVKRVTLSDARITGYNEVGGIAAHTYYSSIEDCTVDANVCIHAVQSNTYDHGGIVGYNQAGPVNRCISRATLTVANSSGCKDFGGIVGLNKSNVITDCIAEGVVIPDVNARGAIVGFKDDYYDNTLTRNYYHGCKVASDNVTPSGVGQGTKSSKTTSDVDGASALWAVTLPNHASVVRTPATDPLPGTNNMTYDNGADINGVPYAKGASVVNLSYDPATITEGYDVLLSVKKTSDNTAVTFTDNDDHTYTIPSMPAADISVSVTQIPVISYIDADGNLQSHGCTPIVSDIHTYQTPGRTDAWYVVNNDVTDDYAWNSKFEDKAVHIILCDGKTFYRKTSANGHNAIIVENGSLSIYGQSLGTGRLIATSQSTVIFVKSDINFNGGIVSSTTTNNNSVYTQNGDITIRRGNITAQAATYGINSKSGTIILGCSSTADHITANGYYAEKGVKVADGQTLTDGISSHTFTGTLSNEQIAAIAGKTLMKSLGNVAYLDGNGQAQTCTDYTILWDSTIPVDGSDEGSIGTADQDSWYVASTDYTFGKKLNALGHVHLILLDGATFTVNGTETGLNSKDLSIYGQSLGIGTLTASATDKAMFVDGNLVINGGITHATGGNYGIYVDGGYLAINGGTINATGTTKGVYVNVTLSKVGSHLTATFDGTSLTRVNIPTNIAVNSVVLDRTFTVGKPATIMLPFSKSVSDISGATFYSFVGVEKNSNNQWIATMKEVGDDANSVATLDANTPYLVMPSATSLTFTGGATLNTTGGGNMQTVTTDWTFKGTYAYKEWIENGANSDEIGKVYGFAGVQKTDIEVGDFVRVASGARIRPMGCYLLWNDTPNASLAPARGMNRAASVDELPQRITVRLVGANGEVTEVNEVIGVNGVIDDSWYTLDGRKLDKQPTTKGLYLHEGRKVVIK